VGFSLDVERRLNDCRDAAYYNDRRNGVRKAHGHKNVDRGYPLQGDDEHYESQEFFGEDRPSWGDCEFIGSAG
jgi:hypothetical protein